MEFIFDVNYHASICREICLYLDQFPNKEEGGCLTGEKLFPKEDIIEIHMDNFYPVKNNLEAWEIDPEELLSRGLPEEDYGYFPDPNEVFKIRDPIWPSNEESKIRMLGFAHSHMSFLPNPSHWDLERVSRTEGYLMPIYSNRTKELKIWYVIKNTKQEEEAWQLKKLKSLAQVELAAIYVHKL